MKLLINTVPTKERKYLLNKKDKYGNTILHYAVLPNDKALVSELVNAIPKADMVELMQIMNEGQMTPLHLAVFSDEMDMVSTLINVVPEKNRTALIAKKEKFGHSVIHTAIMCDKIDAAKALISAVPKSDVENLMKMKSRNGDSVSDCAIRYDQKDFIDFVKNGRKEHAGQSNKGLMGIIKGAVSKAIYGQAPQEKMQRSDSNMKLHTALAGTNIEQIENILKDPKENKWELASAKDQHGNTPLHVALYYNDFNAAHKILDCFSKDEQSALITITNIENTSPIDLLDKVNNKNTINTKLDQNQATCSKRCRG